LGRGRTDRLGPNRLTEDLLVELIKETFDAEEFEPTEAPVG
jgi:hypothetical protein